MEEQLLGGIFRETLVEGDWQRGDPGESRRLWEETLPIVQKEIGEDHPNATSMQLNLAVVYQALGDLEKSEEMLRDVLESRRRTFGPTSIDAANVMDNLAVLLVKSGRPADAERFFREAFAIQHETLGKDHWRATNTARNLAITLHRLGRHEEGLDLLDDAIARVSTREGAESNSAGYMIGQKAEVLLDLQRHEEALRLAREAVRILEAYYPDRDHYYVFDGYLWLALILERTGAVLEAVRYAKSALVYMEEHALPEKQARARCLLGRLLAALGDYEEAEMLLRAGLPGLEEAPHVSRTELDLTSRSLAQVDAAIGLSAQAGQSQDDGLPAR